ncbi:MAG: aconitase X [Paracoccaceae bacterium]|nr:aconitase X [Paracoccaceae bacterium]
MTDNENTAATLFVNADAKGQILVCEEGLSFWGGVDPDTAKIIDVHHPNYGELVTGKIVMMSSSRGSCSGSGVLLQLARKGLAPAALIFWKPESILTLGAIISDRLFSCPVPTIRLSRTLYKALSLAKEAEIKDLTLVYSKKRISLSLPSIENLRLTKNDIQMLDGSEGPAKQIAMEVICLMASIQHADELLDVNRAHIDGCILAHNANLDFAEKMYEMGAKTCIPTTINAISVDRENWRKQGQPIEFGLKASRLADAYVKMGAQPTFTCAPYLLDDAPEKGEIIGWSESNAVVFANSVLGAWTEKHPDYFDLFIACTGRAPKAGVYLFKNRVAVCKIKVTLPKKFDESLWPMLGWLAGVKSQNGIPVLTGLEFARPSRDDLKAFSAAFGTTSSAPMFYMQGHMPDDTSLPSSDLDQFEITCEDVKNLWVNFNCGSNQIDLVAIGSPHASSSECKDFADLLGGRKCAGETKTIITVGRETLNQITKNGVLQKLKKSGVQIIPDICWCSITKPIFPVETRVVITNSGKYAHYGQALTSSDIRFGGLKECATAALTGYVDSNIPNWLL